MAEQNGRKANANMHEAAGHSLGLETEVQPSSGSQQDTKSTKTVPFTKLFSFADSTDCILMIVGFVGAVDNGICFPISSLLFGKLADSFGQNQNNKDVVGVVSKVALKYVYSAMGAGMAAFIRK
ncbi:unnamed protein product [Ilex paraguariensis]|uniref:Major facilitator superfamily (MFS) profile domain-containing protein n=1 Tax=Ilex paraguariensis TaxID=185542 RepID=A0ABC8UX20_9AQUA